MRLEIVSTRQRLVELEPAWWQLWHAARATPFQSPAWLMSWIEVFATHSELWVPAVLEGDRLLALLPLSKFDWRGERWAAPLGSGISDYLDALIAPDAAREVLALLGQALERAAADVQRLELGDVPEGSRLCDLARAAGASVEPEELCPAVALGSNFAEHFRALPEYLRRNLKQGRARLERLGRCEWRVADEALLPELLSALFELHEARWRTRGQEGVLRDDAVREFHRRAAPRLLQASLLRLFGLYLCDKPVAAVYVLHGRDAHYYASGFEPELYDCSPGSLLIAEALRDAIDEGRAHFDFLRGSEPYKYAWRAVDQRTQRLVWRAHTSAQLALGDQP